MSGDEERRPDDATVTATGAADQATSAPAPLPPTLGRGAALGRYLVIDRLGGGGMGVVYLAYDPELDRKLAVKVLRPDAARDQARLLREARAMARLSHPNVIAVHDVGTFAGGVFVAMELVDGATLSDWLAAAPRDWREVIAMFVQAGRGLAAAHAVGLVHRDFTPANALVGRDGRVRVVDFGLARAVDADAGAGVPTVEAPDGAEVSPSPSPLYETLTRTGALLGTPRYMAPEMWQGRSADARSDQFGFSVALYRALYGTRPFGDGDDLKAIRREVTEGRVRPPPKDSRVPAWLRDVVLRGLAVDPAARWAAMDAMLAAMVHDPAQRRRRVLVAGGALAAAVAMAAGARSVAVRDERMCRAGADRFAGVWDAARRDAVHRAFVATGVPYAETAFASVARALDGFAGEWAATYRNACEATRVRHEQSDELYDLRMDCLQQRMQEANANVDLFTHADAKVVQKSVKMASSLTTTMCSEASSLREPVRPPADAATQAKLSELRARLARARVLYAADKYNDALTVVTPLVSEIRPLAYAPLLGAALEIMGSLQVAVGDFKAAQPTLEEATAAARAGRDTRTEANAWMRLARNATAQAQYDRGRVYTRYGFAALDASPTTDDRPRALLLLAAGQLEAEAGNLAEALAANERALAMREKIATGNDDIWVALAHESVARVLGDLRRFSEQETHVRRALAIEEALLGRDNPTYASTLFNLGYAQKGQHRSEEALKTYREVAAIWRRTLGPEHPFLVVVTSNIAGIRMEQGKLDEALENSRTALALSEKSRGPDHPDTALAAGNVAEVLLKQGKPDEALTLAQRALAICEKKLAPTHRYIVGLLIDIGEAQLAQHQAARAIEPLERAVETCGKSQQAPESVGDAQFALGRALWAAERDHARARKLAEAARPLYVAEKLDAKVAAVDAWLASHR